MKKHLSAIVLIIAMTFSTYTLAREVTLTTQLKNYSGSGAYMAIYLTDSNGVYKGTLWIAGRESKYYSHLRDWAKGSLRKHSEYDGLTGASITSGRTLKMAFELDDSLIDSGYQIRVDSAVEDMRDNRFDVIAPLTTDGVGKVIKGRGYVQSFMYEF